jgi:hypothetical protein
MAENMQRVTVNVTQDEIDFIRRAVGICALSRKLGAKGVSHPYAAGYEITIPLGQVEHVIADLECLSTSESKTAAWEIMQLGEKLQFNALDYMGG